MKSFIEILTHPYLLLNRVGEQMYPDAKSTTAAQQRLRSRTKGVHYFQEEDYQKLRELFIHFARQMDQTAGILAEINPADESGLLQVLEIIDHPWMKKKVIMTQAGKRVKISYYTVYDCLRGKNKRVPKKLVSALGKEHQKFADWIRLRLKRAEKEKGKYLFSQGLGAVSHRGKGKKKVKNKLKKK